jgi:hypothetical protein
MKLFLLQWHWEFPCYSHTRDVIGPVFQPDCRLVAVTLPQGGINDKKKNGLYVCEIELYRNLKFLSFVAKCWPLERLKIENEALW